jgi:hypothetical protein
MAHLFATSKVLDAVMYAAISGIKLGAAATAVAGFGKLILPFQ